MRDDASEFVRDVRRIDARTAREDEVRARRMEADLHRSRSHRDEDDPADSGRSTLSGGLRRMVVGENRVKKPLLGFAFGEDKEAVHDRGARHAADRPRRRRDEWDDDRLPQRGPPRSSGRSRYDDEDEFDDRAPSASRRPPARPRRDELEDEPAPSPRRPLRARPDYDDDLDRPPRGGRPRAPPVDDKYDRDPRGDARRPGRPPRSADRIDPTLEPIEDPREDFFGRSSRSAAAPRPSRGASSRGPRSSDRIDDSMVPIEDPKTDFFGRSSHSVVDDRPDRRARAAGSRPRRSSDRIDPTLEPIEDPKEDFFGRSRGSAAADRPERAPRGPPARAPRSSRRIDPDLEPYEEREEEFVDRASRSVARPSRDRAGRPPSSADRIDPLLEPADGAAPPRRRAPANLDEADYEASRRINKRRDKLAYDEDDVVHPLRPSRRQYEEEEVLEPVRSPRPRRRSYDDDLDREPPRPSRRTYDEELVEEAPKPARRPPAADVVARPRMATPPRQDEVEEAVATRIVAHADEEDTPSFRLPTPASAPRSVKSTSPADADYDYDRPPPSARLARRPTDALPRRDSEYDDEPRAARPKRSMIVDERPSRGDRVRRLKEAQEEHRRRKEEEASQDDLSDEDETTAEVESTLAQSRRAPAAASRDVNEADSDEGVQTSRKPSPPPARSRDSTPPVRRSNLVQSAQRLQRDASNSSDSSSPRESPERGAVPSPPPKRSAAEPKPKPKPDIVSKPKPLLKPKPETVLPKREEEEDGAFLEAARARLRRAKPEPIPEAKAGLRAEPRAEPRAQPRAELKTKVPPPKPAPRRLHEDRDSRPATDSESEEGFAMPKLRPASPTRRDRKASEEFAKPDLKPPQAVRKPSAKPSEAVRKLQELRATKPVLKPENPKAEAVEARGSLRPRTSTSRENSDPNIDALTAQLRQLRPRSVVDEQASADNGDSDPPSGSSSESLHHPTKGRAKGPKRRLPTYE